ncbi:multiple coagulation factor deficiency protein 2 homolog isoform X3 [Spodoptera frugiperda]|uniref:Multiple coagulation factor deficiency protein 2 homolog isoform X3 n=1 Tax=Spodoptera frugiperda TaxID=7108 RepID=A0A9R0DK11_SPOFR|nr:multiple coagulation factor deficiency protein 2 homolog isoform X3 [Spodoptera frugiperda]
MLRLLFLAAFLQCTISQQYQQKVAPGVPPQNYQNYQQPPPPPPPQQQQYQQQQQQQYQQPPPPPQQQQQYQPPPPPPQQQQQQYQQPQQQQQQFQQPPQQQQHGHAHHGDPQLLNPANIAQERDHIQEHMEVPIDTSKMSEQELQFHYFKMHDADNNNKLDGCELIKSLIHWHVFEKKDKLGLPDKELENMVDNTLKAMDVDNDGYVTWTEYRTRIEEHNRIHGEH